VRRYGGNYRSGRVPSPHRSNAGVRIRDFAFASATANNTIVLPRKQVREISRGGQKKSGH
jgi:hypothetical protein